MSGVQGHSRTAVAVIVVGRNVGRYGGLSLESVFRASVKVPHVAPTVVSVDDCSYDETRDHFIRGHEIAQIEGFSGNYAVVHNEVWLGFSLSILAALKKIDSITTNTDLVFVLPGNHQVEESSIVDLLNAATVGTVILGYRVNKRAERPPLKWMSSCVLQVLSRVLISRQIRDITGQFMVPPDLLRASVSNNPRHAWSVHLSRLIVDSEYPIREIPIRLIKGFRSRPTNQGFRRSPRLTDIVSYVVALFRESRFSHKTSQRGISNGSRPI